MEHEPMKKLWNANYTKVWVGNFLVFFSFMLLMPLLPLYLRDTFGSTKETIGMVLSGYTIAALIIRPFSGYMVDSFQRKTVLIICYFLFFALFAGYLVASTLTLFTIFRTLHGLPFGAVTVSGSTVAVDVLDSSRRTEGIGYYGLSNNIATALGPSVAMYIFHICDSYDVLFYLALGSSFLGLVIDSTLKLPRKDLSASAKKVSLDRFFLMKGWNLGLTMSMLAFSYGVISTYLAIYGKDELNIEGGAAVFFALLAVCLILSRLVGGKSLRKGRLTQNASMGMIISIFGYLMFAALHNRIGYYGAAVVIGLGNGHMFPAFQNMFINLAENNRRGTANSTLLTAWDIGVGLGVLVGGIAAEFYGFHAAFWIAWGVNVTGVLLFFTYAKSYFLQNRLR